MMNLYKKKMTQKDTKKPSQADLQKEPKLNDITELVFILDRSGSMSGLERDTIGGFNAMIQKQKQQEGKVYVSTVLFNHESQVIHDRVDLKDVQPMTETTYMVGGCTALLDAIGGAIHHIANIHKYARKEDVPAHTLFIITTDGMENASKRYHIQRVKEMIEHEKTKYGWEFLFLGANIDAIATARAFGIDESRAVNYHADAQGTRLVYETVAEAACNLRASAPIDAGWKHNLENDYNTRSLHS